MGRLWDGYGTVVCMRRYFGIHVFVGEGLARFVLHEVPSGVFDFFHGYLTVI